MLEYRSACNNLHKFQKLNEVALRGLSFTPSNSSDKTSGNHLLCRLLRKNHCAVGFTQQNYLANHCVLCRSKPSYCRTIQNRLQIAKYITDGNFITFVHEKIRFLTILTRLACTKHIFCMDLCLPGHSVNSVSTYI